MCCEATDALLEYVRRYLGLTGLRNLNAPRRLKLRVPVLKEWLQRQGQHNLAASIPDWDPVRRPTGRWKAWEMQHLKPIMDEKAVERQAKRNLVSGEANQLRQMREQAAEDNKQDAIEALMAVAGPPPGDIASHEEEPSYDPDAATANADTANVTTLAAADDYAVMVVDDANEGSEEAAEVGAESSQGEMDNMTTAGEATAFAAARVEALRSLMYRIECCTELQGAARYNILQAVEHLSRQLAEGSAALGACPLRPPGEAGASAADPVPVWPQNEGRRMLKSGDGERPEHVSSQEEAALLLGASQVSLSGSVLDVYENSQPESQPEQASSDGASPREGGSGGVKRDADEGLAEGEESAAARAAEEEPEGKRRKLALADTAEPSAAGSPSGSGAFATSQEQDSVLGAILEHAASQ